MEYPSFDMDVKFKDGSRGTQDFYFSDKDNLIEFSNGLNIEKDETGKWHLHFTREYKEMQTIAKAIALPNEINLNADTVNIPLSRVSIADNGNIEFELETTKDRRTGNTRNFTITPNSIKTSSTEIPFEQKGQTVGVKLPKNFPQLFLGNNQDSTIKNALPVEFFNVLADYKYKEFFKFDETNKHTLLNANIPQSESIDIINIDGNFYTLVNSKMMKIEAVSHVPQETSGYHDLTFVFKKGSEHIARTFKRVNTAKAEELAQFMGISLEDWNTKNRHLGEDPVLTTAILTAKEFKTTDRSRVKNLTSDGIDDEKEEEQAQELDADLDITPEEPITEPEKSEHEPETHAAAQTPDENKDDIAQGIVVDESEHETVDESEITETTSEHASDETAADAEHSEPAADPEQTEPAPNSEETEQDPASTEPPVDGEQKADENPSDKPEKKKEDKKDKKEAYKFSLAPLFYGIGLTLGVLSILTGMVWLLALGALFFATPKMTEGIVNDRRIVNYQESERVKKFKKSLQKTKEKIKDNLRLQGSLIKTKDKDLKPAHKLLRQKTRKVKMTKEWTDATKDMFEDGKISANTKDLLNKLEYPAKSSQFKNHSKKLKQFDEFLKSVQKEIESTESRFNDRQKEELAPLVRTTLENLKTAQDLNSELSQASSLGSALKNEANFSTLTQHKMAAGLQELGLETKDIVDEAGKSTFGDETITMLNQQFDDKFQTYKEYLDKDGVLEENIADVYATMDKFQSVKTTNKIQTQQP